MKAFIAPLFLMTLMGCGSGNQSPAANAQVVPVPAPVVDDNHGYGYSFDVRGDSGMTLRYSPTLAANSPLAQIGQYEATFREVEKCTGITAPEIFVVFAPAGTVGTNQTTGRPSTGRYFSRPSLIAITEANIFEHEIIHYLLDVANGDLDPDHKSTLFLLCAKVQ